MGEVLARQALAERVARERAAGRTVAFANGCFDILHVGHVRYLQAAASDGTISDRSCSQSPPIPRPTMLT